MTPRRFRRLAAVLDRRQPDLTVLMDNVHKPHNLSAVIRTCDAVGVLEVHAVSPHPITARHDSAGGSGRWVRITSHPDHDAAAAALKGRGLRILAAHPVPAAVDFRRVDYTRPTALLLGSELDGVSSSAAAHADGFVAIPMHGAVASLNVSVAAAVILYEAQRQRAAAGLYARPALDPEERAEILFEWAYPRLASLCRRKGVSYPRLGPDGELLDPIPRG
ncbi:MAG: tRNA (guanosine(18)-2'-O)-methyltransferase TrmH [Acidobacteria bacterium]|nr:MAG: tRNA (guanosine(18)-2'-O)-methyltransferase TrmH [Acidobacteriota bacterium]